MKKLFLFGLIVLGIASCSEVGQNENLIQQNTQDELAYFDYEFDLLDFEKKMKILEQKNQTRLANASNLKSICDSDINVPLDYLTIQEAVDNICDGGTIIIETGIYYEEIYISKPGIKIIADGEVELNGGFVLNENADETTIKNFKINMGSESNSALTTNRVDRLTISQNEIRNPFNLPRPTVILTLLNESTIHQNEISGISAILLYGDNLNNGESANKNVISNNILTNSSRGGITTIGNMNENIIKNNTFLSSGSGTGGIAIVVREGFDNNQIKNNKSDNGRTGFISFGNISGNEISGNEFLNHNQYGIYIVENNTGEPNIIKNNKVKGNSICDIVYGPIGNVLINNDADCVTEF